MVAPSVTSLFFLSHLPQDVHQSLCRLILANGSESQLRCDSEKKQSLTDVISRLQTDSSLPGVERLVISALRKEQGLKPKFEFTPEDVSQEAVGLLDPHGCFIVKGWSRALAATTILLAAYEDEAFFQAGLYGLSII